MYNNPRNYSTAIKLAVFILNVAIFKPWIVLVFETVYNQKQLSSSILICKAIVEVINNKRYS